MKKPARTVLFSALIMLLAAGAVLAQPATPKEKIPEGIPAEMKAELEKLYSAVPEERALAVEKLAVVSAQQKKESTAIPYLIEMLADDGKSQADSITPSQKASSALLKIGEPAIDPLIMVYLRNEGPVADRAAEQLVKTGQPAVSHLMEAYLKGGSKYQARIKALTAKIGAPAIDPMLDFFSGGIEEQRTLLAVIMGVICYGIVFAGLAICIYIAYRKKPAPAAQ